MVLGRKIGIEKERKTKNNVKKTVDARFSNIFTTAISSFASLKRNSFARIKTELSCSWDQASTCYDFVDVVVAVVAVVAAVVAAVAAVVVVAVPAAQLRQFSFKAGKDYFLISQFDFSTKFRVRIFF